MVDAWRLNRPGDLPLEERIRQLLFKIGRVHEQNPDPTSKHIVNMIQDIIKKAFKEEAKPPPATVKVPVLATHSFS